MTKRIGVVTFSNTTDNYGQVMQYWALQETLKGCGSEPMLLRFTFNPKSLSYAFMLLLRRPASLIPILYNFVSSRFKRLVSPSARAQFRESRAIRQSSAEVERLHPRHFEEFRQAHFSMVRVPSFWSLPEVDTLVAGSDQIWAEVTDEYFLHFGSKQVRRISYASSFGRAKHTPRFMRRLSKALSRFDAVSVRELSGLDLCRKVGRDDALCLCDPTLLLTADDYRRVAKSSAEEGEYILIYLLGTQSTADATALHQWAEREGLRVVYVASQGREDDYDKRYAEVGEWLSLIAGARYVFTNSYHGAIFSMIYERDFLLFPVVGAESSMNERIATLGENYATSDRIYSGDLDRVKTPIDYRVVKSRIAEARKQSLNYLIHNI